MADGIDFGIEAEMRAIFDRIREEMPATMEAVGHVLAAKASAAAPTPDEEWATMMVGEGNPQGVSLAGLTPNAQSDGDHRMRFFKPAGDYLQPTILEDVHPNGLSVGVGDPDVLNAASIYEWRNVTGQTFRSTFPFWECWEYGLDNGTFMIFPRIATNKKGKPTTLKPGLKQERYMMEKIIPRKRMYGGINVDDIIENTILPAVRKLAQNA